ncbi:three-helix bundle dimerization domain-containing protein [Rhodococcus gannanensis]|uniref:Three-helix bundle dimerization domain-containing protein n=1 Tax=Rhodococcus gannanensis TaxID=1960308 RepID=A0ABW4NZW5_9NOCA
MAKDEKIAMAEVQDSILRDHPELTGGDVAAMIARALEDFDKGTIREFVPLFVERRIRAQLAAEN